MPNNRKTFTILAGPNGSGKTTFVHNIFPELLDENLFINADHFAHQLNPKNPSEVSIQAGRVFLNEVDRLLYEDHSFIIETTLSGLSLLKKIQRAKEKGFQTRLIFLWISSVNLCDFRVKGRVASGGHNIPSEDIHRRYKQGLQNLDLYKNTVDHCDIYLADAHPKLIYSQSAKGGMKINDEKLYTQLNDSIKHDSQ